MTNVSWPTLADPRAGTPEQPEILMEPWGYDLAAFVLGLIGVTGVTLNSFVIYVMIRNARQQSWTPMNIILMNLVCSDFLVSALGTPWTFVSALSRRWPFGRGMCVAYGFFMALLGIGSITTLTVLSFERRMIVSRLRPSGGIRFSKRPWEALAVVAGIWCYALLLTVPPLIGWGHYRNEAANISCSVNWESRSKSSTSYILFLFATGLAMPLAVILYSYCGILRIVDKTAKRHQNNHNTCNSKSLCGSAEHRVTRMVFLMVTAFLVAWSPYAVMALLEQFATNGFTEEGRGIVSPAAAVAPSLLAKSSVCYNPIIYVIMNPQFKTHWRFIGIPFQNSKTVQSTEIHIEMNSPGDKR